MNMETIEQTSFSIGKEINPKAPESLLKERIFELNKPFIYFHTHDLTRTVLDKAKASGKSLEVDMSVNEEGQIYVGHPLEFYKYKKLPPPENLPLETVKKEMLDSGLFIVLDCKDVKALPKAGEIISDFGAEHSGLHAWAEELQFKRDPSEKDAEPHWKYEDIPLKEILKVKSKTNVPVIISARRLTMERLNSAEGEEIFQKIVSTAEGKVDAINFNLPEGEAPPLGIMNKLLEHSILTWLKLDRVPEEKRPKVFLGMSDEIESASNPQEFRLKSTG
jgi:hypothetical protein